MFRNKMHKLYLQEMLVCRVYQNIGCMNQFELWVGDKIKMWFNNYIVVKFLVYKH